MSCGPQGTAPVEGIGEDEYQILAIQTEPENTTIAELLQHSITAIQPNEFSTEQRRDPELLDIINHVERGELPTDPEKARQITLLSTHFSLVDDILYLIDTRNKGSPRVRVAVPKHLQEQLMEEQHRGLMGAHFSGNRLFGVLSSRWWWKGMHGDAVRFARNYPDHTIVSGGGRVCWPPHHPIPVKRPFQIFEVDIMDLPTTQQGNKHVVVLQDYLTKWPLVFPFPDQRSERLARLVGEEVVPVFGVPECLLSDR